MDEGFCTRCGKRVTVPTTREVCDAAPHCGPFESENTVRDEVLLHTARGWRPAALRRRAA